MTPRYHLQVLQPSPGSSSERVLTEDSQKERRQKDREPSGDAEAQVSDSELFHLRGDSPISASIVKVIGEPPSRHPRFQIITSLSLATRTVSCRSPPSTVPARPLSRPSKSMPVGDRHYRRSPSFPSQDSFGGSVSQDPAARYLASAKQFDVPLSDLGETPTQEVIHSPTDPGMTLPDASEHKEFLDAAMRKYEAERANRPTSNRHPNVLVVATPSNSGGSSGTPQHKDDFSFPKDGPDLVGQESRFEFNGSSSFDKMLDQDLADAPDPTPEPIQINKIEHPQAGGHVDCSTKDNIPTAPLRSNERRSPSPPFEWIAPAPSAAVASSNPRSLLRIVHPAHQYRIAKMRNLAGNVEPRSHITGEEETQSSHMEEMQCPTGGSTHLNALPLTRPSPCQTRMAGIRSTRHHQPQREDEDGDAEDALDIVPDSEPLRAGPSAPTPSRHRDVTQSPLKKLFRPLSPMSEHVSGDLVPYSSEVEESEADVPLAVEVASRNTKRLVAPTEDVTVPGRKPSTVSSTKAIHSLKDENPSLISLLFP